MLLLLLSVSVNVQGVVLRGYPLATQTLSIFNLQHGHSLTLLMCTTVQADSTALVGARPSVPVVDDKVKAGMKAGGFVTQKVSACWSELCDGWSGVRGLVPHSLCSCFWRDRLIGCLLLPTTSSDCLQWGKAKPATRYVSLAVHRHICPAVGPCGIVECICVTVHPLHFWAM